PKDWVYRSAFGEEWEDRVAAERLNESPLSKMADEALPRLRETMDLELGRPATDDEFVLYTQHPKAAVDLLKFRATYGDTTVLPTPVWLNGLRKPGDAIDLDLDGRPHVIKLVSIGEGIGGVKHVVLSVDNIMHVFPVDLPESLASKKVVRKATPTHKGEIGATVTGNVWRIGTKDRALKAGDHVRKGEEIMNIEVMKTENAVKAPIAGILQEIAVVLNDRVEEGQLLAVIGPEAE
ncbi:MAG TPA: biotin/lipoyl-containing protein, partial [Candidatus Deferrimicrobiaceae bacterium]